MIFKFRILSRVFRSNCLLWRSFSKMEETNIEVENNLQISNDLKNLIYIDKVPYTAVTEGKAEVLFPSSHDVFYNPVQEFNRDLSIAMLKQFVADPTNVTKKKSRHDTSPDNPDHKFRILEALAASGLRSIRFAKEIENLGSIVANDKDSQAYLSMQRNIKHNNVEHKIEASNEDASLLMYKNRSFKDRFDVVDLDPYGTATPFLDAGVQCVADGGLLMVTCTDMAVLCGNGIEACHAKYGAVSAKIGSCHEMALRILLQSIESHANRYGRYIEPILSLSVDFYVRVFVRLFTGLHYVKQSVCKLSLVYFCSGCGSFHLQPLGNRLKTEKGEKFSPGVGPPVNTKCSNCGHSYKVCGPIWSEKIHNREFVQKTIELVEKESDMYQTSKRILGMLSVVLEELEDSPLFHRIERLSSVVHVVSPPNNQIRSAILNAGYKVSISHTIPTSVKTDAPQEVIWDIIRAWANLNPGKKTYELEPSKTIMAQKSSIEVSFEPHPDADPKSRSSHLLRFQINPAPNWGPKCRATTSLFQSKEEEKRIKKQSKRLRKNELSNSNKKGKNENDETNNGICT